MYLFRLHQHLQFDYTISLSLSVPLTERYTAITMGVNSLIQTKIAVLGSAGCAESARPCHGAPVHLLLYTKVAVLYHQEQLPVTLSASLHRDIAMVSFKQWNSKQQICG